MTRKFFTPFALLLALVLSACSHYHMGSKTPPFKTLYIEPAHNKSLAPQIQSPLTAQLRQAFMRNTTVSLAPEEEADVTLIVTVTDYTRTASATREDDSTIGRAFSLRLMASCMLRDNRTGEVLFSDRKVSTDLNALTDGGFQESEYRAMAALAEDLSLKIKNLVVSAW